MQRTWPKKNYAVVFFALFIILGAGAQEETATLFEDDFSQLPSGRLSSDHGAHTEYHFTNACRPIGGWQVSSFDHDRESQIAWKIFSHQNERVMAQTVHYPKRFTHPMVVAGDSLWQDYTVDLRLATPDTAQTGICVRYQNSRCYYFVGLYQGEVIIKRVNHASALYQPDEVVLASREIVMNSNAFFHLVIALNGEQISVELPDGSVITALDPTYQRGKIALLSDGPAYYSKVKVTCSSEEFSAYVDRVGIVAQEEKTLQMKNPGMKLYKKFSIQGFGVGRNLRFGDLNNDGQQDVLIGQVVHHGPQDAFSELSCLTAMTFDGEQLWRIGKPDNWKDHLTNDVAFQIHDLDGDGRMEVIYCMKEKIIVAEGATGITKYEASTPPSGLNAFERRRALVAPDRILGDCIYFADFRGQGHDRDIVIKDRYKQFWVLDDRLNLMWKGSGQNGHYPYAWDIDNDGKDELAMGYSLYDNTGQQLWTLDDTLTDHADGIALVKLKQDQPYRVVCAASDEGMFFANLDGEILRHHFVGHAQNPIVANLRDDLPGLESLSINFWGNQGIINLYDSDGRRYKEFEPVQHGSMCLPVSWNGSTEEFFVLSANVEQGGLYDGWGRRAVRFPDDGHPDLCNAVLDVVGDARDEIIVWDTKEVWIYTQDDDPQESPYRPIRNPMYNYSNYQTTVSLPPEFLK